MSNTPSFLPYSIGQKWVTVSTDSQEMGFHKDVTYWGATQDVFDVWGDRDLVLFREHLPSTQDAPGTVQDPRQEGHFPCPLLGGLQTSARARPEVWSQ